MSESLSNILNNLSAMPVTSGFIEYRKNQFELGYAKAEINIDAQLLEYYLISLGLVAKTDSIKNDFYFDDMYVDVKEVNNKWFNVGGKNGDKKYWWTRNVNEGELTHFLFIKSDRNQSELLSDGDTVNIKEHAIWQATEIINQLQKSNYGGYYMDPKLIFKKKE
jgi:hypothetical protein|tara:strand:- start:14 stop:505 length:492 start_codon:yes stop_codon:yes gene_type:complete